MCAGTPDDCTCLGRTARTDRSDLAKETRLKRGNPPLFILFETETEMKTTTLVITITLAICMASAASEAEQVPFILSGYVLHEDGSACNNPDIAITNLNTGKPFPTMTLQSSNYYRADPTPSSDEVNEGDLLRFTVGTDAGSAAIDHRVTESDLAFGLFLNLTVSGGGGSVAVVTDSGAEEASIAVPAGSPEPAVTPPAQESAELQDPPAQAQTPREPEQASQKPGPASPEWESKVPGFKAMFGAAAIGLAAVVCLMLRRRTG